MLRAAGAAGGDDRDVHRFSHRTRDFEIVAVLRSIGVHAGQNDFAGPELLDLPGPGQRLQTGGNPATIDVHVPDLAAVTLDSLGINIDHNALAAEPTCRLSDEIGVFHRGGVDGNLVRACIQEPADVV